MHKHTLRTCFFTLLTLSLVSLSTAASSGPDIESVTLWPNDIGHNDDVYVDAEISGEIDDVWYVARTSGERIATDILTDKNNDGYYVSPIGFIVEGGQTYTVEVNACTPDNHCSSETVEVEAECSLSLVGKCFY